MTEALCSLLRNLAGGQWAVWTHRLHRVVGDALQDPAAPGFARDLSMAYQAKLGERRMMSNELYLTLVYRPNVSRMSRALQSTQRSRATIAEAQADALRVMEERSALVGRVLRGFGPQLLGTRMQGGRSYSEVAEVLGYLVNGWWRAIPMAAGPLYRTLPTTRLSFGGDKLELRHGDQRRYAALVDIKEYADAVEPGILNSLLYEASEFIENAKKALSDHAFAKIEEEFIAEKDGVPLHLTKELERSTFEQLIDPLLRRTMDCLQKALDDAKINAGELKQVVLVGGSTRSPVISRLLEARLGQPAHREVHPDLCVAMGAAIQAAIIAGSDVGAVLVDITPHSVGIKSLEVPDSFSRQFNEFKFAPVIPRNTPLPTSRSEIFCTVSDNQSKVDIDIYQGESGDVRRNHRVGKFLIEGLARVPAGNQLVVQMDLTLDGTLKVTAKEKATGMMKNIVIDNAMARFAVEEKDAAQSRLDRMWAEPEWSEGDDAPIDPAKLADLLGAEPGAFDEDEDDDDGYEKFPAPEPEDDVPAPAPRFQFPADTAASTAGQREAVQARALLEKAERVGLKANAEDQAELGRLTTKVRTALDERRWPDLTSASNALADVLFYLEDA